jgi:protein tyrosine phosphatase (PTP) superfamily phosphohydrolase (DUF442 family)
MCKLVVLSILVFFSESQSFASEAIPDSNTIYKTKDDKVIAGLLSEIRNYRQLSLVFSSAGMPKIHEFTFLKQNGYKHIINLVPGDFDDEQKEINELGMTFDQIEVDWNQPTLANFQKFVELMKTYRQEKVLVHCRLNYRASAFAYLYQVTQLGIEKSVAQKEMYSVWQPKGAWLEFINKIQLQYQMKEINKR